MSDLCGFLQNHISRAVGAIAQGPDGPHETLAEYLERVLAERYAVIELPPVHPEEFTRLSHAKVPGGDDPTRLSHAKVPGGDDPKWAEVSRRTDGRIQLASINNPFRSDAEARDTAAAILAILAAKDAK